MIYILKKNPLTREPEELNFLKNVFSYIPFFQHFQKDFNEETYLLLIRKLRYEYGKKERKIFNYGDMGRKFYIILSGGVYVLVPKNQPETKKDNNDNQNISEIEYWRVNELKTGDSFGEIALLNSVPRTASCICKEDTHFVVLTSESYMKIVG